MDLFNKKKIKTMNKMAINTYLSAIDSKKLSKQEQIHRNRDHMEGYQWEWGRGRMEEKVQGIRSINGRYKIDRGRLRIV